MTSNPTRREFLRQSSIVAAGLTAMRAAEPASAAGKSNAMPTIKLGDLEVSRLFMGSNPFFGFAHKPGNLGREMRSYYTDERIIEVLEAAADQGITAVWTPCYDRWIKVWNKYRDQDGKLKIWIGQPDPMPDKMKEHITLAAENGAKAICIQGLRIDVQIRAGRFDVVRDWLEYVKSYDLPAGMATHRPETHLLAEEKKLPTDFYHQCFYQPENYSDEVREQAITTIKQLEKPVVGYKVLAAGRLSAEEGFGYAFKHLRRKDGVCVGLYPPQKPDQITEDAGLARKLTSES